MIEIIVGSYKLTPSEQALTYFDQQCLLDNPFNQFTSVLYAEELGLTKETIREIIDNAQTDIKIVVLNNSLIKGIRNSKKVKITYEKEKVDINPFDVAKAILNASDRKYIFDFLKYNKVSLFVIMKLLSSTFQNLNEHNRNVVAFADLHMWKCNPEICYAILAFKIIPQNIKTLWLYPKKEEKE